VTVVGLLHPGEMGAAVGALLVAAGHEVRWLPAGRGEATARRARTAGLTAADDLAGAEIVLSVCPPHAAAAVARSVPAGPLFADLNAIPPATARAIGAGVDGGIVGPPPERAGTTRLYLSCARAGEVAALFAPTVLEPVVLAGSPVAASALKMAYAAWTKGTAALLLAIRAAAAAEGVEAPLRAEWTRSQPDVAGRLEAAERAAAAKGWRWVGEMEEIAATLAATGQPAGFHTAAAEVFSSRPSPPGGAGS
jgi:3-hydroxyisobutyrate dehydrogenase-like beta-hydroxyacid dehydrogenase